MRFIHVGSAGRACNGSGGSRSRWSVACHQALRSAIEEGDTALLHWYDGAAQHEIFVSVSDFGTGSRLMLGHCNFGAQLGLYPYLMTGSWLSKDVGCDDITCPADAVLRTAPGSDLTELLRSCELAGSTAPMVMGTFVEE